MTLTEILAETHKWRETQNGLETQSCLLLLSTVARKRAEELGGTLEVDRLMCSWDELDRLTHEAERLEDALFSCYSTQKTRRKILSLELRGILSDIAEVAKVFASR